MQETGKLQHYGLGGNPKQHHFSPYASNGGNTLAISGDDFAIIAADTRLSEGFSIHSRTEPKTIQVTPKIVLGMAGFHGDSLTLKRVIDNRIKLYEHEHGKFPSIGAVAAMLSTILYYRRFFPYYVYNLVAGVDEDGKGCVYSYDPVGCYERESYRAEGSAAELLQPLLDNQIGKCDIYVILVLSPVPLTTLGQMIFMIPSVQGEIMHASFIHTFSNSNLLLIQSTSYRYW